METELGISRREVLGLRGQLSHVTIELDHLMSLCHVTGEYLLGRVRELDSSLPSLQADLCGVGGQLGVVTSINQAQAHEIQVKLNVLLY